MTKRPYKVSLSPEEIKPKSPIREREVDFEEYMAVNVKNIMDKLIKMENENIMLKAKLSECESSMKTMNDNLFYLAEKVKDKTLSNEKKWQAIQKIQEEQGNTNFHINRLSSDGIAKVTIGSTTHYWV